MTDQKIAEYFGLTDRTLRNWKKGDKYKQRMYVAMREMVGKAEEVDLGKYTTEQLIAHQEDIMDDLERLIGQLQVVQDFIASKTGE